MQDKLSCSREDDAHKWYQLVILVTHSCQLPNSVNWFMSWSFHERTCQKCSELNFYDISERLFLFILGCQALIWVSDWSLLRQHNRHCCFQYIDPPIPVIIPPTSISTPGPTTSTTSTGKCVVDPFWILGFLKTKRYNMSEKLLVRNSFPFSFTVNKLDQFFSYG